MSDFQKEYMENVLGFDKDSFVETWVENQAWQVEFQITAKQGVNSDCFRLIDYESSIYLDGQEFIVKKMTSSGVGSKHIKSITAPHICYTMQDQRQYNVLSGKLTIQSCLKHVFGVDANKKNSAGFSWEVTGNFISIEQENFGNNDWLSLVTEIQNDYMATMIPDNKHLVFRTNDFGEKTENEIRYRENTNEIQLEIDTLNFKTQIRGTGKKDEDGNDLFAPVTYTSPMANVWGVRVADPVDDERYTDASSLTARLKNDLQDYPEISGAVTLTKLYNVNKCDYVMLIYEPLNFRTDVKVCGYKKYHFANKAPDITLSNRKKDMQSMFLALAKKIMKGAR